MNVSFAVSKINKLQNKGLKVTAHFKIPVKFNFDFKSWLIRSCKRLVNVLHSKLSQMWTRNKTPTCSGPSKFDQRSFDQLLVSNMRNDVVGEATNILLPSGDSRSFVFPPLVVMFCTMDGEARLTSQAFARKIWMENGFGFSLVSQLPTVSRYYKLLLQVIEMKNKNKK